MKLRALLYSLIALLTVLSAATASADPKGDGGKVRLLFNPAGTQSFPPFVIQKLGLDKKYGFQFEAIPVTNAAASNTAIQTSSADIGLWGWTDLARLRNGGVKVIGIAPFLGWANTVIIPVDSPIKTLADIKGKKIGVLSRIGLDWIAMRALAVKQAHLDLEKDATIQEAAVNILRTLLEQGQLDITEMYNDLTPAMIAGGKMKVMTTTQDIIRGLGLPDAPFLIYAVREDYAKEHPDNVKAFVAAYAEAIRILKTNDQVWADHGADLKMTDPAVIRELATITRPYLYEKFEPTVEKDIQASFAAMVATAGPGLLGMTSLPDGFLTLSYQ